MSIFFGKRRRAQQMARTDAQVEAILAPAEKRAATAKRETTELVRLIEEVKATNDFPIKLFLATNGGKK